MTDLTELEQFDAAIYQLAIDDDIIGGADGVDNLPHKQLANRTAWLKQQIEALALQFASQDFSDFVVDLEFLAHLSDLNAHEIALALPLAALDYPTIDTADNRITVTPTADTNGGTVSIPANIQVALGEEITAGKTGVMRGIETAAYTSADLDINSTYYLRAKFVDGVWTVYTQKGTDADAIPTGLQGTVDGANGGGFDSTVLDVLFAKVVTGTAGTLPVVTELANSNALRAYVDEQVAAVSPITSWTNATAITLDWARIPDISSAMLNAVVSSSSDTTDPLIDAEVQLSSADRYALQAQFKVLGTEANAVRVGISVLAFA